MKEDLKIGLFGMYGLYNYGCEAIVRGTYELITRSWPNCKVTLYTYRPDEDREILKDLDIEVKNVPKNDFLVIRQGLNKVFRAVGINKQFSIWNTKQVVKECDIVFSVGGDIYTIPKHILNSNKEKAYSPLVEFGKRVLKDRAFVIWGASIGPFGEKKKVRDYYFNHLAEVTQIFSREEASYRYLSNNNIENNLNICPDPAYFVPESTRHNKYNKSNKIRIALNLSPLSVREQMGEKIDTFREQIINTIDQIREIQDIEIVLVPHVISPLSEGDNDLSYLRDIYNILIEKGYGDISLLEDAKGFLGTKEFLKTCDIVVAARMHCAVNAICEGVPTIFLCYSQKGEGMANYIYDNSKWAVNLLDIDKELKDKVVEMLNAKEQLSEEIKDKVKEIRSNKNRIIEAFRTKCKKNS